MADVVLTSSGIVPGASPDDILPELTPADFAYTAPGIIRRLPAPLGDGHDFDDTVLSGQFMTSDDRNDPGLLFITAYRQGPTQDPEATFKFYDGYGIAVMPLNGQSAADGRHNIFVVRNSTAVREVVLDRVIHTGWGDAAYLASVSKPLDPDTWYSFKLKFRPDGGLDFYLTERGVPFQVEPTLSWGAYRHGMTNATYYGIATSYSDGHQWSLEDFYISYYTNRHPIAYFEMDAASFPDGCYASARAYATGWDDANNDREAPGIKMLGYNYATASWDLLDYHRNKPGTSGGMLLASSKLPVSTYRSPADKRIRIALIGEFPSNLEQQAESNLFVDTIHLENWNTAYVHVGGKADIYLRDSSQLAQHTMDLYNVDAQEWLVPDNTHIATGLVRPVMWVTSIELIDAQGHGTGVFLTEDTDYSFDAAPYPSLRYSARERCRLLFEPGVVGSNVRITFLTYNAIETVQTYIDNPSRRNSTDDYLARACNPWRISSLVLDYRGSLSRTEIRQLVVDYVLGMAGGTLSWDELEDYLNKQENVTDVDVVSWQVDEYADNGDVTTHSDDVALPGSGGRRRAITMTDEAHQMWAILPTDVSFTAGSD